MVCAHFVFLCNKTKIIKFYSFSLNISIIKKIKISGGVILDGSLQLLRLVGLCSRKRRMRDLKYIENIWLDWEWSLGPLQL